MIGVFEISILVSAYTPLHDIAVRLGDEGGLWGEQGKVDAMLLLSSAMSPAEGGVDAMGGSSGCTQASTCRRSAMAIRVEVK